jgi:hypothetical protein
MMVRFWFLAVVAALVAMPFSAQAQVSVKGYFRSNGTYVQPHTRSAPNNTRADNWSTIGNINPYTGQKGTTNPPPRYVPVPNPVPYVPYAPYVPYVPTSPATKQKLDPSAVIAVNEPHEGIRQDTEFQSCFTIYDCQ